MKKHSLHTLALVSIPLFLVAACGDGSSSSELSSARSSGVIIRSEQGASADEILDTVNKYRADLGGDNNLNAVGTQAQGHREINWDGVPADKSAPNLFPGDFFKTRGILISAPCNQLQVSARTGETAPVEFANINSALPNLFNTFSPEKLFAPLGSNILELTFTVPGSTEPATVSGFGSVFTDVDLAHISKIDYYDQSGKNILSVPVEALQSNETLSFVGATFTNGQRIAKVRITAGNVPLSSYTVESKWKDLVVVDDFLYSEPKKTKQW